ncbi:bifunctional glycosyltransferase family 2/GtrA family protein [Companilactobacillus sp. HBUAS59699]|uniref:bifunctional glycosyltransferase family 2/GtrA family protein n=1 Tax=Companilactobacillus sp. HBUAS59699 TaxID=3109358 RepID=UPI002FF41D51
MTKISVLIPALNPDDKLIALINQLKESTFFEDEIINIVIVDDGSDTDHQHIFEQLLELKIKNLHILHHDVNRGKGAALKTGFKYIMKNFPEVSGIATMDSDGQHTVKALEHCIEKFNLDSSKLVLGVRKFTEDIPLRSSFGNILTSRLVKLLTHQNISDTQTGLRIIPISYVKNAVNFPGDRFEYEFDMLLEAHKYDIEVVEQPIPTIYLDGNKSSHFRVIRDSIAIYSRFLKFATSGLISFFIDITLFSVVISIIGNHILNSILIATVVSRVLSSIANYLINHHLVFNHAGNQTMIKYGTLFIVQMFASGYLTNFVTWLLPNSSSQIVPTIAKMMVDFMLFIISYQIQRDFIFKDTVHVN